MKPVDLTEGKPWSQILRFMLQMLLGNIAQQLYNTADSVIVGRYVGDLALAAVGSAGPILNLLIVLFVGISTGAGQPMATMRVSLLATFAVRLPLAYLMVHLMRSPDALYWSQLCAWTFGTVYSYYLYRKGKWRAGL